MTADIIQTAKNIKGNLNTYDLDVFPGKNYVQIFLSAEIYVAKKGLK